MKRLIPMTQADREQVKRLAIALERLDRRRELARRSSVPRMLGSMGSSLIALVVVVLSPSLLFRGLRGKSGGYASEHYNRQFQRWHVHSGRDRQ